MATSETREYVVGDPTGDTPFKLLVHDETKRVVYRLECHNGDYDDTSEINYSGDFQCALFSLENGQRASGNLLAAADKNEQSSDWFNRGRMLASQLWGNCGNYAEYGATRHFRLRGMQITLSFEHVRWRERVVGGPRLARFRFRVAFDRDANAASASAEKPGVKRPPSECMPAP